MKFFFTSDTHFHHENIIKYCNRPFSSVEEMNEVMVQNWNSVVKPSDTVFHLGDFSLTREYRLLSLLLGRLNGHIILIAGDHDDISNDNPELFFAYYTNYHKVSIPAFYTDRKVPVTLCHYAMRVWDRSHYGTYHLYGHSHGRLPELEDSLSFDVGVDSHNFTPWSEEEIVAKMKTKKFIPINERK